MNAASFMELNRYSIVEVRFARMIPSIATNTTVSMDTDSGSFHIQLSVVEASPKDILLLSKLSCTPKKAHIYVCVHVDIPPTSSDKAFIYSHENNQNLYYLVFICFWSSVMLSVMYSVAPQQKVYASCSSGRCPQYWTCLNFLNMLQLFLEQASHLIFSNHLLQCGPAAAAAGVPLIPY